MVWRVMRGSPARLHWIFTVLFFWMKPLKVQVQIWAKTNMTRTHGRCPKGKRLHGKAPYGHWKTMTFVAGLRCDGVIAPMLPDGPMNGLFYHLCRAGVGSVNCGPANPCHG